MNLHAHETQSRLLAKLVRELLASERFETLADLEDALKTRCAKLKIHTTPDDISEAFRLIASNTELVAPPAGLARRQHLIAIPAEAEVMSKPAASRIYQELKQRFGAAIKTMPKAAPFRIDIYGPVPRSQDWGDHDRY